MVAIPTEGSVVQFRRGPDVALGVVIGRKNERTLHVLADDGRVLRLAPQRVLQTAAPIAHDDHEAACARLRELRTRALAHADVDLELLWSQVRDDKSGATIPTLCRIYLGASGTDEERLGFGFALCTDRLWFRQQGEVFVPRMESEIIARRERLEAERLAAERRARFVAWSREALARAADGAPPPPCPGDVTPWLDRMVQWAVRGDSGGQLAREARALLEEIAAELPGHVPAPPADPDGAFRLLVALGEFHEHENLSLRRLELPQAFDPELERIAAAIAPYRYDPAAEPDREDLRSLETITIDAADTTDRDDALSLRPLEGGRSEVGIHIADAAHWVAPDSPLDREARRRATSVYLPDRTIPMFPRALAESRMSLDEGGDRPALSLLLELDAHGAILTHRITRSVIRVRHNLSYEEADAAIAAGREPLASLARLLEAEHRRRLAAGAVQVPGRDRTITPGRDGSVRIEVREQRTAASALVSEAMILANRLAAETLAKAGAPAIYRRQKLSGSPPEPASFPCTRVYAYHVRRKLGRTELGTEPGRHATLGIDHYVQVTSPIRRYQDLAMQRQLAAVVERRAPVYDAQQVTEILRDTERATGDAGQATRETELYWVLEHVRQAPERRWEAIVLGPLRDRRVLLEIPALDLRTALKPGRRLAAGTRVELALASVHPRRGEYRFRITKVLATPPPRDETPEQTPEPHATSH